MIPSDTSSSQVRKSADKLVRSAIFSLISRSNSPYRRTSFSRSASSACASQSSRIRSPAEAMSRSTTYLASRRSEVSFSLFSVQRMRSSHCSLR